MNSPNNSTVEVSGNLSSTEEVNQSQNDVSRKITEIKDSERYTGYGKRTQQGWIFQLKLLMLFLWRATNNESIEHFRLASEYGQAKSLDDLVFQYKTEGTNQRLLRLLQAKQRGKDIKWTNLKAINDQFSLPMYFHSFLKVKILCSLKSYYTMLSDTDEIKDIILVTNANTNNDVKCKLIEDSDAVFKDDMLQVDQNTFQNTTCFKIKPNSDLNEVYKVTSDLNKLVKYIAYRVENPSSQDKKFKIVDYDYPLMKYVFQVNNKNLITFRDSFLTEIQTDQHCINPFKQMLIDKIANHKDVTSVVPDKHREKAIEKMSNFRGTVLFKHRMPSDNLKNIETFAEQLSELILNQKKKLTIGEEASQIVKDNVPNCLGYVFVKCYDKVRFNTFFLDDKLSENLPDNFKTFRNQLKLKLNQKFSELFQFEVEITDRQFQKKFKNNVWRIPEENVFNINLPVGFSDDDIKEFERKFKLIVNYPDHEQLMGVLNKCTGKDLSRTNAEVFNALFYDKMHHWFADPVGIFYTKAKAKKLFSDLEVKLQNCNVEFNNRELMFPVIIIANVLSNEI